MKLTIELVPQTAWFSNVRSHVSRADWEKIKRGVKWDSGARCEICGGVGPKWPVECHEIWDYDDEKHIQTLKGMIALCPDCHMVKHIGLAGTKGKGRQAIEHLMKVNNISLAEAQAYVDACFELWNQRSQYEWILDISLLKKKYGIIVDENK